MDSDGEDDVLGVLVPLELSLLVGLLLAVRLTLGVSLAELLEDAVAVSDCTRKDVGRRWWDVDERAEVERRGDGDETVGGGGDRGEAAAGGSGDRWAGSGRRSEPGPRRLPDPASAQACRRPAAKSCGEQRKPRRRCMRAPEGS